MSTDNRPVSPEEVFLQDIVEAPEDDVPRLIYADWLDDHGRHERANFIRVQCALARLDEDDPARAELQAVERDLLAPHRARWLAELPTTIRQGAVFERGFVESYPYDKVFGLDPERLMFDKRGIVIGQYDLPISYNTDLLKPDAIKSWDDLLDPKYAGKILVEAHAYAFGILANKWGEAKTNEYIKKLVANREEAGVWHITVKKVK